MKDAGHMCTKNVNMTGAKNIVMQCQQIFQSYAEITMIIIGDGLDLEHLKSLVHKMDVYQAHN
jgi:hypothetical protein